MLHSAYPSSYANITGAAHGCIAVVHDKTDEINFRIWQRDRIDRSPALVPDLSVRSQYTKYTKFHVCDVRNDLGDVSVNNGNSANASFHPNAQHGQPAKFRSTIDIESQLQNRGLVALQKNSLGTFVPQADGPLYRPNTIEPFSGKAVPVFGPSSGYEFAKQQQERQMVNQAPRGSGTIRLFNLDSHARNS